MKRLFFTALILFYSFISFSQNDTIDIFDLTIEEILNLEVETASKNVQKISDAPSIISVITRSDLEKTGVLSLIDALKYIPGIETSMGVDGQYRLSIRGERKKGNILLLIDGQPFNDFYDGLSIYDLPVEFIEKIEIIRGPGSALFGTNAVAGVINIITILKSSDVSIKGGTNMTYSGNLSFRKRFDNTLFILSGGYIATDGANVEVNPRDFASGKTNRWLNDAYIRTSITSNRLNIGLYGLLRNQGSWVSPGYDLSPDSKLKSNWFLGEINYDLKINDKITITPRVYSSYIIHDYLMQEHPDGTLISGESYTEGAFTQEQYDGLKIGSDLQGTFQLNDNLRIISGLLYENLSLLNYQLLRNYKISTNEYIGTLGNHDNVSFIQDGKSREIYAFYAQGEYVRNKFGFTAGFRADIYNDFGASYNPRFGIVYKPTNNLNFKLLYGQAFRAPLFKELYDKTNYSIHGVLGSENLKPETLKSAELAVEYVLKKTIIRANIFYNISNNLIGIFDVDGSGSYGFYKNIGKLNSLGGEFEAIFVINKYFNFFTNYSQFYSLFTWNENILSEEAAIRTFASSKKFDSQLHNIPNIRVNSGINILFWKISLFAGGNFGSKSDHNARTYFESDVINFNIPSYIQGNFFIEYKATDNMRINISGNNLGKIKFSDPEDSSSIDMMGEKGMQQPYMSFLAGFSYIF
jgi:outer membrane receptor for ferrienterochelin and colicins